MMRVPALVLAATVLAAALPSMPGSARSDPVPGEITLERELALSGGSRAPETRAAAVADFNEDGLLDIASLGGSATSSILLLLGDNEHEFARSLPVASDAPSDRIVAGDFDEDGHNDLMHGVLLLRGRGDGSFAEPEAVSSESIDWPSGELAADLDGDGHLDLAITYEPVVNAGSRLVVLWGHGDGTFEAPSQVTYLSRGFKIHLAADLTEDGMLDLVGGSSVYLGPGVRSDSLVVFPSLGSRAFGTAIRTVTEGYTHALSVADLDHDGHLDIVVYDRVHAGDGTGAFDPVPSMLPARGEAVATPDLDLDGWNDIVFQDGAAVRVVRNREGQGFDEAGRYLIGFTAHNRPGLVVADLDVDGLQDVVAFPHMFVSGDNLREYYGLAVLFGRPGFRLAGTLECLPFGANDMRNAGGVTAIRLRADGRADLIQAYGGSLYLVHNLGVSGFGSPTALGEGALAAVIDLDRDGLDDLVIQAATGIEVRRGDPILGLAAPSIVGTGTVLAAGDVDGGPGADLLVSEPSGAISLLSGDGSGGFAPPLSVGTLPPFLIDRGFTAAIADLDGDGLGDLAITAFQEGGDSLWIFHSNGHAPMRTGQALEYNTDFDRWGAGPGQLAFADLDGDGDSDALALRLWEYGSDVLTILTNDGNGSFAPLASYDPGADALNMVVGDLDGDGVVDVAVSSLPQGSFGALRLFRGRGDGTFDSRVFAPETRSGFSRIAIGRFDADDRLDIAVPAFNPVNLLVFHNISVPGVVTPVLASLVSASIDAGVARITWSTDADPATEAIVLRSLDGATWSERARLHPDGDGRVRFEDTALTPGQRVGYRLAFSERGALVTANETWLAVPLAERLALAGARPNPVAGDLMVAFSLARRGPGTLALFDLAGRRIAEQDVSAFGAGEHRIRLAEAGAVRPGLYFIRLVTTERTLTARAIVMR